MDTLKAIEVLATMRENTKLFRYSPYPWQKEFHKAGSLFTERMIIAGNRTGKTYTGAHEVTFHLTGLYPEDWSGIRFKKAILCWVGGVTNESLRDITQKELLGGLGEDLGTGSIPKHLIGSVTKRQAGISDVVDTVKVKHVSGKWSECVFKSYEQGWKKWQGTAPDVVWLDEEPDDLQLYTEARTRLITSGGIMIVTFTPLSGLTPLLQHFYDLGNSAFIKNVTWDDSPHLDEETKRKALESFPEHERDARSRGIPMRGEGVVFPFPEATIKCDPFQIPRHWPQIIGIDFGWGHPAATAKIAYDPDNDMVYVTLGDKESKMDALDHCEKIRRMGGEQFPIAWPHDGMNTEKGKGEQLIANYKIHNLNFLSMSSRHKTDVGGGQSKEKTVMMIYERIKTGRFKVFSNVTPFFEEFRNYHRKDNKIVDKMDDLLSAVFYAIMMLRFAVPEYIAGRASDDNMPTGAYI